MKFFGWLNRMAQPSPIQSWNEIGPSVVSAVKSGAVSLMRRLIWKPLPNWCEIYLRRARGPVKMRGQFPPRGPTKRPASRAAWVSAFALLTLSWNSASGSLS